MLKDNEFCVIADPRNGEKCPSHHNCQICEHLRVRKMVIEDVWSKPNEFLKKKEMRRQIQRKNILFIKNNPQFDDPLDGWIAFYQTLEGEEKEFFKNVIRKRYIRDRNNYYKDPTVAYRSISEKIRVIERREKFEKTFGEC